MSKINPSHGISTLVNHAAEGDHAEHAHTMPIFQTSTFEFPDVESGAARFRGEQPGYIYSRLGNPNAAQTAAKIAVLEGCDLLRRNLTAKSMNRSPGAYSHQAWRPS
jgi:methionine-gamma-lyase